MNSLASWLILGAIRRNVTLQHFTQDDEYLRIVTR